MSRVEHLILLIWTFVMLTMDLYDYHGGAGLMTVIIATIISFYIYYIIGFSFFLVTKLFIKTFNKTFLSPRAKGK